VRFIGNQSHSDDYDDGNGDTVPSRWDKWNGDVAVGWTPDADTLLELTAGKGDGEARYAGRGMDGSQFKRESLGLRFEKSNLGEVLDKVEAQVYYNYADHVMDNYSLRTPSGTGMMGMPMVSNVDRRTLGARIKATWRWADVQLISGIDAQTNEHRQRSGMGIDATRTALDQGRRLPQLRRLRRTDLVRRRRDRLITGARLDRASARDFRKASPTQGDTRADTLPSGFVRYEHDLAASPRPPTPASAMPSASRTTGSCSRPSWPGRLGERLRRHQAGEDHPARLRHPVPTERLEAWASGYVGQVRDYILFDYRPA
jgi:iron complex outermembrane receptor protein